MTAALTAYLVVWGVLAWTSVFVIVPWAIRSMYRYRLWRLRDAIIDEVRPAASGVVDRQPFEALAVEIECAIQAAPDLTLFRCLLMRTVAGDLPSRLRINSVSIDDFDVQDRRRAAEYLFELQVTFRKQLLLGAPSGWVMSFFVGIPVLLFVVTRSLVASLLGRTLVPQSAGPYGIAKGLVAEEIPFEPEPVLALLNGKRDHEALSLCV